MTAPRAAKTTDGIIPIAIGLFERAARANQARIQQITDHGDGAYLYSTLASEAWVCAQKDVGLGWPHDRIEPILTWKSGPAMSPLPNPSVPVHRVSAEVLGLFCRGNQPS